MKLAPGPALVVELDPVPTIAVGRTPCARGVDPRAVVVVTRDEPRHPWQSALVRRLRSGLPELVHVESGVPGESAAGVRGRLRTYGASRASATTAVRALCGGGR